MDNGVALYIPVIAIEHSCFVDGGLRLPRVVRLIPEVDSIPRLFFSTSSYDALHGRAFGHILGRDDTFGG